MLELPQQAREDIPELLAELERRGFEVVEARPGPMHSYLVTFEGPCRVRIVADRGQLSVDEESGVVSEEQLQAAGLWRVFDDYAEFSSLVLAWLDR